jgi:hypothetical protein
MVHVLQGNPKKIHTLHRFEQKLFAHLGLPPPPPTPICSPGFTNDGLTCRRDVSVVPKPRYGRTLPNNCGAGDAGLCCPLCVTGYHSVGPVCYGSCPQRCNLICRALLRPKSMSSPSCTLFSAANSAFCCSVYHVLEALGILTLPFRVWCDHDSSSWEFLTPT